MSVKRILIIDDQPYILKSMQYMLEDEYEVDTALTEKDTLELLNACNGNYDLIISDLSMPDINGASLYLHISQLYPDLEKRFIFMTGGAFGGYINESPFGSSHPCISKPFESEELHRTIKKFIRDINA